MRTLKWAIYLLLTLASVRPAHAQTVPPSVAAIVSVAGTGDTSGKSAAARAPSAGDLQDLVNTLQDNAKRAQLVKQLQTLIAVQKATAKKAPAKKRPALESAAQGIIEGLATKIEAVGVEMVEIVSVARMVPPAASSLAAQASDPAVRLRWLNAIARLAVVFIIAAGAAIVLGRMLRPARKRIAPQNSGPLLRWLAVFVAMMVLTLLPIVLFAGLGGVLLALANPEPPTRQLAVVAITTITRAEALRAAAWVMLLSPAYVRFLEIGGESRTYLFIWTRRFILWAVYGFGVANAVTAVGGPVSIDDLIVRLVCIVLAGLAIVLVLQSQASVTHYLRGSPIVGRSSVITTIRTGLADTWHILAIVYILGSFGSYIVDLHGGFAFVLRATLASVAVLIGAGLAIRLIQFLNRRGFEKGPEARWRYSGLPIRANRYLPALTVAVSALVYIIAIVLLLGAWGTNVVGWFELQSVRRILGTLVSIAVIIVVAVVLWELIRAAIERALGAGVGRSAQANARLRTLLPLARSLALIAVVVMAGFVVLSQIGVNIAPFLAGAGIIGIAVGLGSQQLVRDVINGLFILIENTISVGDWVDVGGGHAGTVEELSIRSMRLRDGSGAVHTIPFSSVTALSNVNRGIGNAAVSVSVAMGEDSDRAARILAAIATQMRQEPGFKSQMLSDLQYWGVDKVDAATVTLVGQIVCTDGGRWPVQREFNRRMMQRFQAEGIAFALPTQAVVMRDAGGTANTAPRAKTDGEPPPSDRR